MVTSMNIKSGDVVICKGKIFKDDRNASGHPYLVLVNTDGSEWVALCCTDADHKNKFAYNLNLPYNDCGLIKPTIAICDKGFIIKENEVTKVIGHADPSTMKNLVKKFGNGGGTLSPNFLRESLEL